MAAQINKVDCLKRCMAALTAVTEDPNARVAEKVSAAKVCSDVGRVLNQAEALKLGDDLLKLLERKLPDPSSSETPQPT